MFTGWRVSLSTAKTTLWPVFASTPPTLCLSTWRGCRFGSKRSLDGSRFTGDWRLPLWHSHQSGLIRPQKPGPSNPESIKRHVERDFRASVNHFDQKVFRSRINGAVDRGSRMGREKLSDSMRRFFGEFRLVGQCLWEEMSDECE